MPAAVRAGSGTSFGGSTSTPAIGVPTGVVASDVLMMTLYFKAEGATFTAPAGVTQVEYISGAGGGSTTTITYIGTGFVGGDSITFTTAAAAQRVIVTLVALTGASTATPTRFASLESSTSAAIVASPAVSPPAGSVLHVSWHHQHGASSPYTDPAGMTIVADLNAASAQATSISAQAAVEAFSAAGTDITRSSTASQSASWTSMAFVVEESAVFSPPTGLTATAVNATRIDLAWTAASGAVAYDIERDGAVIAVAVVGTAYSDTGLTAATTYSYRVRSVA